jgi:two-component system C4-dicarboxylate transport sensor histidine kinase DctB
VRDHGPGLSAEAQAHLFEPFFTTKPAGDGLASG